MNYDELADILIANHFGRKSKKHGQDQINFVGNNVFVAECNKEFFLYPKTLKTQFALEKLFSEYSDIIVEKVNTNV